MKTRLNIHQLKSNSPAQVRHKMLQQRGIGIVGMLLALVIAAALTAVAIDQFNESQKKTRISAASSELMTMVSGAQQLYGTNNQYGQVTTAVAVQSSVVPARLRVAGTNTAQNKYNGAITFAPATITTTNDSLTLTYANVLREDCQDVVNSVQALMRQIQVAATDVKPADGVINVGTMATQCDSAARVNIAFTFGRQ